MKMIQLWEWFISLLNSGGGNEFDDEGEPVFCTMLR
jgi:hypothetical protein